MAPVGDAWLSVVGLDGHRVKAQSVSVSSGHFAKRPCVAWAVASDVDLFSRGTVLGHVGQVYQEVADHTCGLYSGAVGKVFTRVVRLHLCYPRKALRASPVLLEWHQVKGL